MMNLLIESSSFEYTILDNLKYSATGKKILDFGKLKDGWNYGEGIPIQQKTIDSAIDLNNDIRSNGFLETDAFPGPDGSIMTTLYEGKDYLEFTIHPDESITYAREEDNKDIAFKENLSAQDAKNLINEFREEIWSSSDELTPFFTTSEFPDIKALHLLLPGRTVASPFWTGIAY